MKSVKFLVVAGVLALVVGSLAACSVKPLKLYEEGAIDEADVVTFDVSQPRVTVHIDGKKVAIRISEVLMAPGEHELRVEANSSFDRNPDMARYDKLITGLRARDVPFATVVESPNQPMVVTMPFTPQAGKKYKLYAELIERPMASQNPQARTPGELVVYIEEEF